MSELEGMHMICILCIMYEWKGRVCVHAYLLEVSPMEGIYLNKYTFKVYIYI